MTLPIEVMNDLMAVYLAGDASAATRQLVEDFAREHQDFAARLRSAAGDLNLPTPPPPDLELAALKQTRDFLRLRSLFLGAGILFTSTPFLFHFSNGRFEWLLIGRESGLVWASLSLAAASWAAHWLMNREVRKAGL